MAEGSRSTKRASSPSWLASLMGAVFLISAGFMLGLIVGVVKEEPDLVIGHLGGQSEQVEWSEQGAVPMPDVAAAGPDYEFADGAETADYIGGTQIEERAELDADFDAQQASQVPGLVDWRQLCERTAHGVCLLLLPVLFAERDRSRL